jgi:hypothetical protein
LNNPRRQQQFTEIARRRHFLILNWEYLEEQREEVEEEDVMNVKRRKKKTNPQYIKYNFILL